MWSGRGLYYFACVVCCGCLVLDLLFRGCGLLALLFAVGGSVFCLLLCGLTRFLCFELGGVLIVNSVVHMRLLMVEFAVYFGVDW